MTTANSITDRLAAESEALFAPPGMDIEEMLRNAEPQAEPGEAPGTVVNRPTQSDPLGMTVEEVTSAGWVRVWDVRTREASVVNRNMLKAQLLKRDDMGQLIFTTVEPKTPPDRGHLLCLLHPKNPDRAEMDRFGFVACPKANLRTAMDVRTHMQHRHKREWGAIEDDRKQKIEAEEREVRQAIIGRPPQMQPAAEPQGPAPVATAVRRYVRKPYIRKPKPAV